MNEDNYLLSCIPKCNENVGRAATSECMVADVRWNRTTPIKVLVAKRYSKFR